MVLRREPSLMKLFIETHMQSDNHQKWVQQFMDNRAQHFLVYWFSTIFLKLLFS
jgi:pentose-5-phosphate-3-epimerase